MDNTVLYLVVPCYNEAECLETSAARLKDKLHKLAGQRLISKESRILFVDDGSKDNTWQIIEKLHGENNIFCGVKLSANRGHQLAVHAGLMSAMNRADCVISIDADLQQDINAIDEMVAKYDAGADVVYGVRNSRDTDGGFKKLSALGFYSLMQFMGCKIIKNHADYRLMSSRFLKALSEYNEVNLFLRGLIPTIGYSSEIVYFDVKEREQGTSKYTMKKMMTLALDGITSFSVVPIHFITLLGIIMLLISAVFIVLTIVEYFEGKTLPGFASIYIAVWFVGGVQLISLGVVGEYVGKAYMESKHRPRYHLESTLF